MLILNDDRMHSLGRDWPELTRVIERAVRVLDSGDYNQPIKPYLRYGDPRNRIIAMPAFLGGAFSVAGIKWIASFPGNHARGLPRAHGVTVLNRADTGQPYAILAGGLPNALRTAAVSGLMLRKFLEARPRRRLNVSIIGWGPIGRTHFDMCTALFGRLIDHITLCDLRGIDADAVPPDWRDRTARVTAWEEAWRDCDVFITCTVAEHRYVNLPPPAGRLLLNVSLRDYQLEALQDVRTIVVDDWEEVCRENTDIELLHRERGLRKEMTLTLADAVCRDALKPIPAEESVLFCPMGMAVFDLAVADYLVRLALQDDAGIAAEATGFMPAKRPRTDTWLG